MPEGDTIFRAAATLHRALAGRALTRFEAPRLAQRGPDPGTRVDAVEARGKHLLVHFGDGTTLRTHLRMSGSWHVYRPGEGWRKRAHQVRARIEVADAVAVCFNAPVVELVPTDDLHRHRELARLGPDLATADADLDEAVARMSRFLDPSTEVGVALLDQRVACGVGNVYRSETLFACGVHPFTPLSELGPEARRDLIGTAARLLRANLDGHPRRTVPGGLAVYGRAGRACRRCGTTIEARRQGVQARTAYWCPSCQRRP